MKLFEYLENKSNTIIKESVDPTQLEVDIVNLWNDPKAKITSKDNQNVAIKVIKYLKSQGLKGKAIHAGRGLGSVALNNEWLGSDKTPKTDLIIGKYNISLKFGPSQVMSGGKDETISTFNAVIKKLKTQKVKKEIESITKKINDQFVRGIAKGNIEGEIKKGKDKTVVSADAFHKEIMEELETFFENYSEFEVEFFKEALSGASKFQTKEAVATHVLAISKSGSLMKLSEINNEYAKKVSKITNVSVRFKSSSRKLKGKKTGEYNYWSVLGLVTSDQKKLIGESFSLSGIWNKIKGFFLKGINSVFEFFGLEPIIRFNNIVDFTEL